MAKDRWKALEMISAKDKGVASKAAMAKDRLEASPAVMAKGKIKVPWGTIAKDRMEAFQALQVKEKTKGSPWTMVCNRHHKEGARAYHAGVDGCIAPKGYTTKVRANLESINIGQYSTAVSTITYSNVHPAINIIFMH